MWIWTCGTQFFREKEEEEEEEEKKNYCNCVSPEFDFIREFTKIIFATGSNNLELCGCVNILTWLMRLIDGERSIQCDSGSRCFTAFA